MIRCSLFKFFMVTAPPPGWLRLALLLVTAMGCLSLWLNPADVDSALGPVLLLQMFSASSGFTSAAARGHFDPVFVAGRHRVQISLAHFVASALPGVCAWGTIALCAVPLGTGVRAFAPHRIVALCIVSTVAWAAGVAVPRLAAGAAWSVVLVALALSRGPVADILAAVHRTPDSATEILAAAGACFICPFLLLADFGAVRHAAVMACDLLGAACVVIAAAAHLSMRDYALADAT